MSRLALAIADASDIDSELVPIPKWGGVTLKLIGMSAATRSEYLTRLMEARKSGDSQSLAQVEADLIVTCALDPETDEPAFEQSDIPMLLTKSGAVIGELSSRAMKLSGLDAKAEERLGKASSASTAATPNDASTSSSPSS